MQDIAQLVEEIRKLITFSRKQYALLQNQAMWALLCSSMDTIEDTELCFDAFLTEDIDRADDGVKYVFVYGTLQALFVQQDAVENLHEALKVPYTQDPSLRSIREIRNDSVGHPTKRGGGHSYNFIARITLESQGFRLRTTYRDGQQTRFKYVNVPELIATQRKVFIEVLDNVIKTLENEEMEHRREFEGKKLANVFSSPGTNYPLSKIFEAILNPQSAHAQLGEVHVDQILKCIEAFKNGLKDREILEAYYEDGGGTHTLELLAYALQKLQTYFRNSAEARINEKDAYIFATFVKVQVGGLRQYAREIDEEYSQ